MNTLEKLKSLRGKATPKEWIPDEETGFRNVETHDGSIICCVSPKICTGGSHTQASNAQLIAAMRNSLDLWLELAEACDEYVNDKTMNVGCSKIEIAIAKLKGEL